MREIFYREIVFIKKMFLLKKFIEKKKENTILSLKFIMFIFKLFTKL